MALFGSHWAGRQAQPDLGMCTPFRSPRYLRTLASPFVIFAAALAIRLGMMAHLLAGFGASTFYLHNECAHIASALASGGGYSSPWDKMPILPTAQQPPVYPFLLAGVFRIFGPYTRPSAVAALGLNAVAAAATAALLPSLAKRCLADSRSGILAGWIVAFWPYEVVVCLQLWSQAIAGLMLVVFLWMLAILGRCPRRRESFGLGCYSGVAALLNPTLLPPLACAFAVKAGFTRRMFLALAGFILVLSPWTIRNFMVFGRFIPLRDNFGFELWVGNHEGLPLRHRMDFRDAFPAADLSRADFDELAFLAQETQQAKRYIQAHPGEYMRRCAWRVLEFWMTPAPGYWLAISLLAWLGAALAWARDKSFLLILLAFPLVYYLTHVWPNYRFPIEPVMILLAVYTVSKAVANFGEILASRRSSAGERLPASLDRKGPRLPVNNLCHPEPY